MKEVSSMKKAQANRRNALRSTGPRTPEGKRASRWNALQHGLLAREVVIPAREGAENRAEFRNLLGQLRHDLQPSGVLEEILVEKIAVCYWRLRRVLRSETGEIRNDREGAAKQVYLSLAMEAEFAKQSDATGRPLKLRSNSFGVEFLLDLLGKFQAEADQTGSLSEDSRQKLTEYFGDRLGSASRLEGAGLGASERAAAATGFPGNLRKALEEEKKTLEGLLQARLEEEHLRVETDHARFSLPEAMDRILRYETAMERQLYRALHQLERIQRRKQGEPVPPPVSVEFLGER
ncbi:MAG: hypothetical protein IH846_10640 [Acidobacteria bacterium]|nr:hypothetical protein [Acidobacteriota bacterium]